MKALGTYGPMVIGVLLLAYVFTLGGICNRHTVHNYMILCTGILSINLGLVALAFASAKN